MATSVVVTTRRFATPGVARPRAALPSAGRWRRAFLPKPATDAPQGREGERARVLVELLPLVKSVACRIRGRLPAHVEFDDLVGAGVLGLVDAVDKFDVSKNVKLETYARHRIRGAVLDGLRALDPASRDLRRKSKRAEKVYGELEAHLGRPVTDPEMSRAMGMNLREWYRSLQQLQGVGWDWLRPSNGACPARKVPPPEELLAAGPQDDPFELCYRHEQREILGRLLARLPERQRLIITLYYQQQLTMKEIGARLGVDESRVSQLHAAALDRLRPQAEKMTRAPGPRVPPFPQAGALVAA